MQGAGGEAGKMANEDRALIYLSSRENVPAFWTAGAKPRHPIINNK